MKETAEEIASPQTVIEEIRGQLYSMGANDSEMPEIDGLLKALETNLITAEQAVKKAREILAEK